MARTASHNIARWSAWALPPFVFCAVNSRHFFFVLRLEGGPIVTIVPSRCVSVGFAARSGGWCGATYGHRGYRRQATVSYLPRALADKTRCIPSFFHFQAGHRRHGSGPPPLFKWPSVAGIRVVWRGAGCEWAPLFFRPLSGTSPLFFVDRCVGGSYCVNHSSFQLEAAHADTTGTTSTMSAM